MKNETHPLMQALKAKAKPQSDSLHSLAPSRQLTIHHHEIPGLPGRKIGEQISVNLKGRIHSQSADGHAVMHVASIKPDSDSENEKTQESQAS